MPADLAFLSGQEVAEMIADGRLPRTTPQTLPDGHGYWQFVREQTRREAEAARKMAERGVPSSPAGRKPLTKGENRFLEDNREGLARCVIPGPAEMREAARVFRAAADALAAALAVARDIKEGPWPTASPDIDNHLNNRFGDLLSEDRVGACWTVTDLRDLADDLDGPGAAVWARLVMSEQLKPRPKAGGRR
jgi:hypothetical protein